MKKCVPGFSTINSFLPSFATPRFLPFLYALLSTCKMLQNVSVWWHIWMVNLPFFQRLKYRIGCHLQTLLRLLMIFLFLYFHGELCLSFAHKMDPWATIHGLNVECGRFCNFFFCWKSKIESKSFQRLLSYFYWLFLWNRLTSSFSFDVNNNNKAYKMNLLFSILRFLTDSQMTAIFANLFLVDTLCGKWRIWNLNPRWSQCKFNISHLLRILMDIENMKTTWW